jgi:hypothetical protein
MNPDPEMLVIVPTRGRPAAAAELAATLAETCTAGTHLAFAVDADDPQMAAYYEAIAPTPTAAVWINDGVKTMVAALNAAARLATGVDALKAIAFMGDDHRPRTVGWDKAYLDALHELGTGIVYGDDLLQHERIPTQVAMTADIVRALGHMAPPVLTHLFVDNYWRDLGMVAGCLRYLPDVVVEHVHPFAGKAAMDEGYARVNDHTMYRRDAQAYAEYVSANMAADVAKVKALR